jgi:hypothetical protein
MIEQNREEKPLLDPQLLKFELRREEKAQLLAIAIRHAVLWSIAGALAWYILWFAVETSEPAWEGILGGIMIFCCVFYFKRRALLRRVHAIWVATIQRHGLDTNHGEPRI